MIGMYSNHLERILPDVNSIADWEIPWEDRLDPWENYEDEDDYYPDEEERFEYDD